MSSPTRRSREPVCFPCNRRRLAIILTRRIDAKAKKDMMEAAKGKKGPLNTGQQGIKKSGKK